ncbi:MAG: hypothetical protein MJZ79_03365 [Paludibacteraceae bacterium]|nr:hypothetical protein [Paludibacteraceae bacterium]
MHSKNAELPIVVTADGIVIEIKSEQPFNTPAVFIEFGNIQGLPLAKGVRKAEEKIGLHIVTDSPVSSWADTIHVFELLDNINKQLHCLHTTESMCTMDSPTLVQSQTDHDFDELQNDIETYSCHVTDVSASTRSYLPSQSVSVNVEAQVQG